MSRTTASVVGTSWSCGTTRATSPCRSASRAVNRRPVNNMSRASAMPTCSGRIAAWYASATPRRNSGAPKVACSLAIATSESIVMSNPPPMHKPLTAAITGLRESRIESKGTAPVPRSAPMSRSPSSCWPPISPPGAKTSPRPVITSAWMTATRVDSVDGPADAEVHVRGERVAAFGAVDGHPRDCVAPFPSQEAAAEIVGGGLGHALRIACERGSVQPVQLRVPRRPVPVYRNLRDDAPCYHNDELGLLGAFSLRRRRCRAPRSGHLLLASTASRSKRATRSR